MDSGVKKYFKKYKKHISQFGNTGILYDIDDLAIQKISEWEKIYEDHKKICEAPAEEGGGYTQRTKTGYSQVRAEYTVMAKAHEMIIKLGEKLGVTPADRAKILGVKPTQKKAKAKPDEGLD